MAAPSSRGSSLAAVVVALLGALASLQPAASASAATCVGLAPAKRRPEVISISDFGGVGDGRTLNTWAFRKAVYRIQHQRRRGGTELRVPAGTWLTGSFNLTSHMTLFLARGAVLMATWDARGWPLVEPLPSYGRGRELPGPRYASFITGDGLCDVVITGE
jgi:polygalacturonase